MLDNNNSIFTLDVPLTLRSKRKKYKKKIFFNKNYDKLN